MEIRVLGAVELVGEDGLVVPLGAAKQRRLLAALACRAGETRAADVLIDALWGDRPPRSAPKALHVYISRLRDALGAPDRIRTSGTGYSLERDSLDSARFERLLGEARGAVVDDPELAAALVRRALALWRGPAFGEFASEEFVRTEAARLEGLRVAARQDLIDAELAIGHHADMLPELEAMIGSEPFDERLRGQLMLALYRAGRQADALAAYRETRSLLMESLGIEPSKPLRELEKAILRHDEALLAPTQRQGQRRGPTPRDEPLLPVRKTVTILVVDVVDSAVLAQRLDPEAFQRLHERIFEAMRRAVERYDGVIKRLVGDSALAVFGIPRAHEDDAVRALRAATDLRDMLAGEVEVRAGVDTGDVFTGESETSDGLVTGAPLYACRRLAEAAAPGDVLLGVLTRRLAGEVVEVEPVAALRLEGRADPMPAYRLRSLGDRAALGRRHDGPIVGRTAELRRLRHAFEDVVRDRSCRLLTVVGDAGIGKSRLAAEFLASVDAEVLCGRCLPYGEGITFWPVVEVVKLLEDRLHELDGHAQEALLGLVGDGDKIAAWEDIARAFRKLLESAAAKRPTVVLLDDLQWSEETLLDLVEHVAYLSRGSPLLLLCLARPELPERRPGWPVALQLGLLDDEESGRLADQLLGRKRIEPSLRARVLSVAAGNPLFVEEMVAWSSEAKDDFGAVPPTIQAVLAARLDQLDRAQRRVLETAAVEGEVFHLGSLRALAPDEPNVITSLTSLARKAFVLPEEARLSGEDAFRFRHLLIRDAAYEALPKARRAELHERLAGWLEEHSYDRFELDEIVGYHLEQAYRLHEALGSRDGQASRLAARAGELLAGAAFRAEGRFDIPAAANLLERAASLLPDEASLQVGVLCELVQSLTWKGDFSAAEDRFDEALQLARALGERGLELHCRLAGVELSYFRGGDTDSEDILRLAEEAIAVFGEDGDELGLARAWEEIAHHYGSRGQIAAHEDALRHQIVHARHEQSGRVRPQIGQLAHASVTGPTPVAEAIRRCDELAREVAGERYSEGLILRGRARLLAMLGRFDEARRQLEESKTVPDALLSPILRAANQAALGELALLAGDHAQAEAAFQSSGEICEHHRIGGGMRAISAGLLAEALYAQGRYDQAFEWTFKSEQNAHGGLNVHIAWRRTRAKLLARRGESGKGETLARELVADLSPTDWLNWRGDALLDLGEVLRLAGRSVEARKIVEEARSLYERKGNVVSTERARRVIGELVD